MSESEDKPPAPECEFAGLVMAEYEGMMDSLAEDPDDETRALLNAFTAHKQTVCEYCAWYRKSLGERVFSQHPDESGATT